MQRVRNISWGSMLIVFLAASPSESGAFAQDLNTILADPQKLVENRDAVVQVYKQFATTESKFASMHAKFKQYGETAIKDHVALKKAWLAVAAKLGEDSRGKKLDNLTILLDSTVRRFTETTFNKHVDPVKDAATRVASVYAELYGVAERRKDELDEEEIKRLNQLSEKHAAAVLTFLKYWNDSFKEVADGMQVRRMIRDAVFKAQGTITKPLLEKRKEA